MTIRSHHDNLYLLFLTTFLMGFSFIFRQIDSTRDIRKTIDFLAAQPLGYPNYRNWVKRAEAELHMRYKDAVLGFSGDRLVGEVLHQPHKQLQRTLEVKNLRVHPKLGRRDFGHFMLKQVEAEARKSENYDVILVDARTSQEGVIALLKFSGYQEVARVQLYDSNEEDVVLARLLTEGEGLIKTVSFFN